MSKFVKNDVRYRKDPVPEQDASSTRIFGKAVSVGQPYHLESDAQFKRDLQQSLEEIVTKRLQEAEDEAIGLVRIAEQTAKINAEAIADDILAKANAQAKALLESARNEVDSIQEAAREEGFKAGFQEGYADAAGQVERETLDLLEGAHQLTEKAYQAEKLVLKNFEKNAVALIEHLTRKILRRELSDSPEILITMVQQAVESLYLSGKIKIVVNAQTLQDIRNFSASTEAMMDSLNRFEFIADPALEMEQVFIVGEEGCFDLSPDQQVSQLITTFEKHLVLPRPEPEEAEPAQPEVLTKLQQSIAPENPSVPKITEEGTLTPDELPTELPVISAEADRAVVPKPALFASEAQEVSNSANESHLPETAEMTQSSEIQEELLTGSFNNNSIKSQPTIIRDAGANKAKAFEFEDFGLENSDEALS